MQDKQANPKSCTYDPLLQAQTEVDPRVAISGWRAGSVTVLSNPEMNLNERVSESVQAAGCWVLLTARSNICTIRGIGDASSSRPEFSPLYQSDQVFCSYSLRA